MKLTSYLIVALFCVASAAALQTINLASGDTITIHSDAGFSVGKVSDIGATYTISDIGFADQTVITDPTASGFDHDLTINAPAGLFTLVVKVYKNQKVVKTEEFLLVVHEAGTYTAPQLPQKPSTTPTTSQGQPQTTQPVGPRPQIVIPRIPDIEPGTTFVLPVTIRGQGTYTVEIPRLDYGTYEVPDYVDVHGERTFPVLLHVDENANPGLYTLQIGVGPDSASARIRIIKYHRENYWWLLIPLGILLIIIGILFLFHSKRKQPYEPIRPQPPTTTGDASGELITYY